MPVVTSAPAPTASKPTCRRGERLCFARLPRKPTNWLELIAMVLRDDDRCACVHNTPCYSTDSPPFRRASDRHFLRCCLSTLVSADRFTDELANEVSDPVFSQPTVVTGVTYRSILCTRGEATSLTPWWWHAAMLEMCSLPADMRKLLMRGY